jgi:Mg2+ and Co2+ transporter CorA
MSHSVKQYEYDSKDFRNKSIEIDLKELQRWRRRTMASEQKIEACTKFIKHSRSLESRANQAQWDDLLEDWVYVGRNLRSCGRTLEAMVSVTQIVDARRSVEETQETTKLTTLALVFVPMSLFASILSMNNDFAVGKKHFYVCAMKCIYAAANIML